MTAPDDGDPYYRAIEEEFARRRGATLLLSPRDWSLIGEWKETGVPLRVVLQAIHNVFDGFERRAPRGRLVNSLSYCRQEVSALHDLYRALHAVEAGRPPEGDDPSGFTAAARHLGRLARRLKEAMTRASEARRDVLVGSLARVISELKLLRGEIKKGTLDPHGLEASLGRFDDELLVAARASLGEEEAAVLETAVEKALASAGGRMTVKARAVTRRAVMARLVREAAAVPRLTLFD